MSAPSLCRLLDWDSEFFGRKIASTNVVALGPVEVEAVLAWCRAQAIDCLYHLSDATDLATLRAIEQREFRLVDIRVTLDRKLDPPRALANAPQHAPTAASSIRRARPSDVAILRAIASKSYTDSRFYADSNFDRARCDELYATWIEKSCGGWAEAVWVAENAGIPAGFVTCHAREQRRGEIGLLGIGEEARGRGLGRYLIERALDWFTEAGLARVTVVTQGKNVAAQRLYQSCGFRSAKVELWHHRWFTN